MSLKTVEAWHTLSAKLLYQWRLKSATVSAMMSYRLQSDIGMSFCQGIKIKSWLFPGCYGNKSMTHWYRSMTDSVCHAPPFLMTLQTDFFSFSQTNNFFKSFNTVFFMFKKDLATSINSLTTGDESS